MSNDTDHTPEDDPIQEQLFKLIDALARAGWKLTNLTIERDRSQEPQSESGASMAEEQVKRQDPSPRLD